MVMVGKPGHGQTGQRVQAPQTDKTRQLSLDNALGKLFNISLDMLCVAGFDGYFRIVNAAFENTLGHSSEVLLNTPSIEFVHPDD